MLVFEFAQRAAKIWGDSFRVIEGKTKQTGGMVETEVKRISVLSCCAIDGSVFRRRFCRQECGRQWGI